jgi:hypothetical protein
MVIRSKMFTKYQNKIAAVIVLNYLQANISTSTKISATIFG